VILRIEAGIVVSKQNYPGSRLIVHGLIEDAREKNLSCDCNSCISSIQIWRIVLLPEGPLHLFLAGLCVCLFAEAVILEEYHDSKVDTFSFDDARVEDGLGLCFSAPVK
jgi:hypothetical protein